MRAITLYKSTLYALLLFGLWLILAILLVGTSSRNIYVFIWVVVFCLAIYGNQKFYLIWQREKSIWFVFILYTLLTTMLNTFIGTQNNYTYLSLTVNSVLQYVLPAIAIYAVTRYNVRNRFVKCFRNFFLMCCVLGIFEYVFKVQIYKNLITSEDALYNFQYYGDVLLPSYRLTMIFYHPIYYGVLLTVYFVCLLYMPFKSVIIQSFAIILVLVNLVLTRSRSGWFSLVLVFVLYLIKEKKLIWTNRIKINTLKTIGIFLFVGIMVFSLNKDMFNTIQEVVEERLLGISDGSAAGARLSNLILVQMVLSNWKNINILLFGAGNNFAISYLQNNPTLNNWTRAIDNQYLTYLLDYGIFGILLVLLFCIFVIKKFILSLEPEEKLTSLAIIAIMFSSIFFDSYGINIINYTLLMFVGMSYSDNNWRVNEQMEERVLVR